MTETEKGNDAPIVFLFQGRRYRVDFKEAGTKVLNLENEDDFFRTTEGIWTVNGLSNPLGEDVFVPREYIDGLNQIVEAAKKVERPKSLPSSPQK